MTFPKRPTSDYPDNFVAITGRNLVDPILKLWVQMGRLHFDGEGVQIINMYHNPEMDTQMLTCICKVENPFRRDEVSGDPITKEIMTPNASVETYKLFEFGLEKKTHKNVVSFELTKSENGLSNFNLLTNEKYTFQCKDRGALFLYVLKSVIKLPELQQLGPQPKKCVEIKISEPKLALLEGRISKRFAKDAVLATIDLK